MIRPAAVLFVLALLGIVRSGMADERKFTYSYEAKTLPRGSVEFEQWATLKTGKRAGVHREFLFREEVEYGLEDNLTTALYLNWEYVASRGVPGVENEHEVEIESLSSEWKYKLTDADADGLGGLLYGEASLGDDEQELEGKIVLSRAFGDFQVAYNFIFEAEREKEEEPNGEEEWEKEYALSNTVGISTKISEGIHAGLEALNTIGFEGSLDDQEHNAYFLGPNVHWVSGEAWATLTLLRQIDIQKHTGLELDEHEKYEVRLIFSLSF